ncbi:FAR1-related sequence 5-like protein [Tanacetum coccineum]
MDSSHSSARSVVSHNSVSSDVAVGSSVPSGTVLNAFAEEIVAYEKDSNETHAVKNLNALSTPESFVTHSNFDTPGGTVYYIPKVFADVLLVKGTVYDSVEDCVVAYMKYAAEAGFVVRRSCQKRMLNGDVKQKYLVCNRMCFPKGIHVDTLDLGNSDKQKRNSNLHITGCKARAVFNLDTVTRKFVLHVFDTIHNHELEREEYKHLSKTERQLTYMEQAFIVKADSVNICATRAHHLLTGIKGSYLLVHGTTLVFKNFFRSVNCYIGDSDAQMLIHKMENRKKHVSDFSFDYLVENAELTAIFWADEVSKYNYREFGDVVSFDATFKTNKYKMVFVPFTAIDNHRKCVTVAAGLLKNETTKSYIWLLKAFMKAFGKAPSIVVTDQDGAMRNAIEAEFGGSKHRLCMWHITQKLPAKICAKIYDETDFKEKLNKIVWNMYIETEEFEYRWGKLMEEFNLENHKWLTKMFNIHSTWIPAYFIDSPLCGLMRMTSRSESENSFFSHFTNSGSTLINFMNCFKTAMEKQRHVQERMDHKTIDTVPRLKTLLKIERHAFNVYTRSFFELVQKEIFVGLFYCQIDSKCLVEGSEVCIIKESPYVYEMPSKKKKKAQSVDKGNDKAEENNKVDMFFKKDGLYKVLRNNANVEMIPQQYILRRWTKNLIPAALRNKRNKYGEKNVVVENYANEATSIVDHYVHLLSKDEPKLCAFIEKLKSLKKEVEVDCLNPPSKNKTDNLEQLVGVSKPPVVDVNNPTVGSTKGRKKLRIKGGKEKAIEKSLNDRNSCSLCGGTDHNKRTYPRRYVIRAQGYRELGRISDMSNSDELRHTDNTTLIPPRLPDTLPQVYHRRRPTLGLLILPSVLIPPTSDELLRMSVLPIEPNLAERARISAVNLDDYQLDPVTPPPSPSSPFSMAAYQRMIAETDPTRREEALTAYGTETGQSSVPVPETVLTVWTTRLRGQLHTILEDMDRYPNACLEELDAFLTLWDVKPRVEESSLETLYVDELITQLRQVCEDAKDRASNA